MSARSFSDPDTLSSDSTDSPRKQLRLVNQRIDDVHRTLRTKDERDEGPLRGSPFVQEIQDAPIPSHFYLPMLEASRNLIHRCHLDQYIMKPREPSLCPKGPMERQIDVIVGGSAAVGVSSSARKSYAHTEVQKRP
ncbi:hypothetical protein BHE74_00016123 [Ensete ventricosum]|nr:hypothetical protein BHE74_00016123 [Ensete ventricosum]